MVYMVNGVRYGVVPGAVDIELVRRGYGLVE